MSPASATPVFSAGNLQALGEIFQIIPEGKVLNITVRGGAKGVGVVRCLARQASCLAVPARARACRLPRAGERRQRRCAVWRFSLESGAGNRHPRLPPHPRPLPRGRGNKDNLRPKGKGGSACKVMENELADWVKAGAEVKFEVKFSGFDAKGRPMGVKIEYKVTNPANGELVHEKTKAFENAPGQTFNRMSRAEILERMALSNNR